MDAALGRLLVLRLNGGIRHRLRQFTTPRGAAFLVVTAGILWLLLGDDILTSEGAGAVPPEQMELIRRQIVDFMPLGLMAAFVFTVIAASGPALHFSQKEIDFLFAGPFSRRALALYKIAAYATGALLSAALFTLLIPGRASSGLAAFAGSLLTLLFVQFGTAACRTVLHAVDWPWAGRMRQPALAVLLAAAGAAVLYAAQAPDGSVVELLRDIRHSTVGQILLAPFAVFANIFLARDLWPELVFWAGCGATIDAGLLSVVVLLHGRAGDHALSESRRLSNRWARMRQGASFWASDRTTGRSQARAPGFGGVGPIAWRQAINAVRNSGRTLVLFFLIAAVSGPLFVRAGSHPGAGGLFGLIYFFFAFIVPRSLVCDFRGELSTMALYKALPLSPWRIVAGQLVVPVALSSALALTMILGALAFAESEAALVLAALTAFTVPASLVLFGLENLIFLLFPTRLLPMGRVDFEFLGRTLVDFVAKTVLIVAAAVAAAAAGYGALLVAGPSWAWFGLASWLALAAMGLATVPLAAWAFRRFPVSETVE